MSKTTTTKNKPETALSRANTAMNLADACVEQVCLIKIDVEDMRARNMICWIVAVLISVVSLIITWLHR